MSASSSASCPTTNIIFSIDTKQGKVLATQADRGDYRQIAGMLQNFTGLPIEVTPKDAHYLNGFNVKIENLPAK